MNDRLSRTTFLSLMIVALVLGLPKPAGAQIGVAVLEGRILDGQTGAPVAGATVRLTSPALQGEETAISDASGRYRIPSLPPGSYTLRVSRTEYNTLEETGIPLNAGATVRVDVRLVPAGAVPEEITVVGTPVSIDVGSSQAVTTFTAELTERIPISLPTVKGAANRSIESVAAIAPQALGDQYGTSVSGSTSPENRYSVDGMSVGDPAYGLIGTPLSMEFVSELNVITAGYLPEYGRTTGGVINAITKQGSNQIKSSVWSYVTPGPMEGPRELVKREASTVVTKPDLRLIYDAGADVGGPIIEDKLWYYAGIDYAYTSYYLSRAFYRTLYDENLDPLLDETGFLKKELLPGTVDQRLAESRVIQGLGKLTYTLDDYNRFSLAVIASPNFAGGGNNFGLDPQEGTLDGGILNLDGDFGTQANMYKNQAYDSVLKWTYTSDDNETQLNTTLGWHHQAAGILPVDGSEIGSSSGYAGQPLVRWVRSTPHSIQFFEELSPENQALCQPQTLGDKTVHPCGVQVYYTGGAGFLEDTLLNRVSASSIATRYVSDFVGSHVAKAGLDVELTTYDITKAYSGQRHVSESSSGSVFFDRRGYGSLTAPDQAMLFDTMSSSTRTYNLGGFVQDSWDVKNLVRLNFGLRYDSQFLYGGLGQLAISLPHQIAPRVGVVYDPTREGNAKVYANYATYYHSIPLNLADRSSSAEPRAYTVFRSTGKGEACDPRATDPAQNACYDRSELIKNRANGLSDPNVYYSHNNSLVPVDPDLKPQSSSEVSLGSEYKLLGAVRVGATYTRRWFNNVIEDMSRDEAQTYFIGNPGKGIAKDFPEAERVYDAFTVFATKPLSDHWLTQASYTLGYLRGNIAGLFRPETGQLDPNINSDFDLKSILINRSGPLPGDHRHNIKIFGAYVFDFATTSQLNAGFGLLASSGAPSNYLGSHWLYGLDEVFILPRGSGDRLPWIFRADVNLGYKFMVADDYSVALTTEIFNLFNFQRPIAIDQRYTTRDVIPIRDGTKDELGELRTDPLTYGQEAGPLQPSDVNPNFGKPTQYQSPLTVRFGVRAIF